MKEQDDNLSQSKSLDLAVRVRADRLHLLFHHSFPAVYTSVIVALLLCQALWGQVRDGVLLGWLVAVCISALLRYALFRAHRRRKPTGLQILAWETPYAITLFAPSLVWGLGVVWIMLESSLLYQLLAFVFLLGMAGGAISLYSARRYMAVGSMACVLLPATLWMLWQWRAPEINVAVAALLFMAVLFRASTSLSDAQGGNFRLAHRLAAARRRSERLAHSDELTGLDNRRAFFDRGQALAGYCERNKLPLSVVMMDADHFKQINDRHGHAVGDAVLRHLAAQLKGALRKSDLCARMGGEEFALLLPDTPLAEAAALAERIRQSYADTPLREGALEVGNTVSVGVASDGYDIDHLLHCADVALYQAKSAGRNRVVSRSEPARAA